MALTGATQPMRRDRRGLSVKVTELAQKLGQLEAVSRDFQPNLEPTCNFWANPVTFTPCSRYRVERK